VPTALIDADIAAFRAAAGGETKIDWGDGETSTSVNPHAAADAAVQTIRVWMRLADCDKAICCFTGRNNFRKIVLPTYKHHRAGKSKPQAYTYVVQRVREEFPSQLVDGLEGDDLMGIMLTNGRYPGAVCVTLDKDLRTVPGLHFNPIKDRKPVAVSEAQADYKWLTQTLTGDITDGYTGLPGIGPKKAAKILGEHPASAKVLWPKVQQAYIAAKLTVTDALTQARVARILRATDYDRATKSVLLWHPRDPEPLCIKDIAA
jgi:hypothetical protein